MRGALDPLAVFRQVADRVEALEVQDFPYDEIDKISAWDFRRHHPIARNIRRDVPLKGGEIENIHPVHCRLFTEVGDGILKIEPLLRAAAAAGRVRYVFLRQDFSRLPSEFESIRIGLENVRRDNAAVLDKPAKPPLQEVS